MDPITEFYVKITGTFLLSGLIFLVMMKKQKAKEEAAKQKAKAYARARGVNLED